MRKIIAIILLLCISCSFCAISAEEAIINNENKYEKVLYLFEYLNVFDGQSSDEIDVEKKMSRADFVSVCAKALKLSGDVGENIFYDVPKEKAYFQTISYFVNSGVLSVSEDRMFRPDDEILYGEALKILLTLAGYDEYVHANGGYPMGYVKAAKRFGLGEDKTAEDTLTYGEGLELMFEVMTAGIYQLNTISDKSKKYSVSLDKTLFSIYRNLRIGRGVLETTELFSMTENTCTNKEVYIDGTEYLLHEGFSVVGYEGNFVEFIYEDNSDIDKVVYLEKIDFDRDISIKSKECVEFIPNSYQLVYCDDMEKQHKSSVQIDKKWTVVYNGRKYTGALADVFREFISGTGKGTIEIKKRNDREAVVLIRSYRQYVVKNFDFRDHILYNKLVPSDSLKFEDYSAVVIRNRSGNIIKEEDLVPETSILIAESEDGELLDILMPERKINAKVEAVFSDKKIRTEDEILTFDETEWQRVQGLIKSGEEYTFWIDAFGEIGYMTAATNETMRLGFIAATSIQRSFNSLKIKVKMLTENGVLEELEFANRINIDGNSYRGNTMVRGLFAIPETESYSGFNVVRGEKRPEDIRIKKQLVRYSVNSNNEINYIDTYYVNTAAGETKETSLTKYQKRFQMLEYRQSRSSRFDRDVLYSAERTKVFTVPWTDDDGYMIIGEELWKSLSAIEYQLADDGTKVRENDYMYQIGGKFTDYRYYNIDVYNYNAMNPYADVIVHYDDFIGNDLRGQVCEITRTIDEHGTLGYTIKILGPQGEGEYFTELTSEVEGLNVGDIIFGETYGNKIYKVSKEFDCKTRSFVGATSNVDYWYRGNRDDTKDEYRQQNQLSKGTVTNVLENCVFWKYDLNDKTTEYDEAADLSAISFNIYEVHETKNGNSPSVKLGTTDQIRDLFTAGNDASYIVCMSDLNRATYAFVFNGR